MRAPTPPPLFGRPVRRIHCVGVGGMGLGPLAIYLSHSGYAVTGEDDALPAAFGALLAREHVAVGPLPVDTDLVAVSSAIAATHPTAIAAASRGLQVVRRGELLAEVVRDRKLVAVCGSHGKTTTTALLVTALRRAHFPAGYVLGGLFNDDTAPARTGSNEWVVAEIDESDGTIGGFSPEITVAVNLDWDHPDFYREPAEIEAAFAALFARTRGPILISDACAWSQRMAGRDARPSSPYRVFGRSGDFSGILAGEKEGSMTLHLGGRFQVGEATIRAQGDFNAANATAALAAAQLMGVKLAPGLLAEFPGVRRRQALLSSAGGVTAIEDYAHHPAEIRALLASQRRQAGEGAGQLIVVFQPHRFSRTARFKAEFAAALAPADRVHLLDVYPAGEAPIAGGTAADIYAELKRVAPALPVSYLPGSDEGFFRALDGDVRSGDRVVFVGAGDIDAKARTWLALREQRAMQAGKWDEFVRVVQPLLTTGAVLRREEAMAPRTTMRVGGAARIYAEPATVDDLKVLVRETKARGWAIHVLGRGSNLIVPEEGVEGVVISFAHPGWSAFTLQPDGRVWVGAGLRLKALCGQAGKEGLKGFEFLEGIPGSVGGALRMNAGAMGGWMFDVVEEVRFMSAEGEALTRSKADLHVGYRHCEELRDAMALGAMLRPVAPADTSTIRHQMDVYRDKRQESQPREPSAGCIFKNPEGGSAGRLIDEAGLKGERVGDAEVSTVHANFIVNRGKATSGDVIELIRRVRARVKHAKGVDLEPEVLLYGKEWRDVL